MAVHPTRANEIYVGTLPAAVYVSENGGRSFRELSAFRIYPIITSGRFHRVRMSLMLAASRSMRGCRMKSSSA